MHEPHAAEAVVGRLGDLAARLGPPLSPALDVLLRDRRFDRPSELLNPLGQPIVSLPLWVASALPDPDGVSGDRLLDLVEATVTGYLHVRVQDDIVDGHSPGDLPTAMLLSDALLVRHQSLIARVVGDSPRFWDAFEDLAFRYGDAMLFERELNRGGEYSEEAFGQVLDRSMPLAIPALAVLDAGGHWTAAEDVIGFVRHTVTAGQLIDDLRDVVTDLDAGRRTWVGVRLGADHGRAAVLGALVLGGFEEIVGLIARELELAGLAAERVGLSPAAAWLEARGEAVREMESTFVAALVADAAAP